MPRHRNSGTTVVNTTVDIYWECEFKMSGRVTWYSKDDSVPLQKTKYEPDFSASELPPPWYGMRVVSRHIVVRDLHQKVRAGRMQSWAYWNGCRWIAMKLPDTAAAAAASAAETAAAASYTPSS